MDDERWKECKHHHDACSCREHAFEAEVQHLKGEWDKVHARLILTAQILIGEVGAEGPLNADEVAVQAVQRIRQLRGERDAAVQRHAALARRVKLAVNEWCSCGGRGPDDEAACSACHVLHMVFEKEV